MAAKGKKTGFSSTDFMKALADTAKEDMQKAEQMQEDTKYKQLVESTGKILEYISWELMDDAPADWNRYPRLKDSDRATYAQLMMSVEQHGTLNALILWQRENGRYMLLAGHNRRDSNKDLYEKYKDQPEEEKKRFLYLPSIVYQENELTDEKARDIIEDTNYLQRPENTKMTVDMVKRRIQRAKELKNKAGETIEELSKSMGIQKSAVYEWKTIGEKLIPQFQEMYFDKKIQRKAALKLALFDEMMQEWIYEKYNNRLTDNKIMSLKKSMRKKEDIAEALDDPIIMRRINITVPAGREEEIKRVLSEYLKNNPNPVT